MKKYLFVINPVAGKGKTLGVIPLIKESFNKDKINYDIKITKRRGQGEEIAKKAAKNGYTHIIAVGGDGTVYEVLNGIKGYDVSLGIIPLGTGNDFVRSIKMPNEASEAIEIIKKGKTKKIDVGKINDRFFLNVSSIGIDAEIVKETEKIKKYFSGTAAYVAGIFATLAKYRSKKVDILVDGKNYSRNVELIAIGNGKYYGGGMKINPDAEIEDGLLDICLVNKMNKLKFIALFLTVFKGKHTKIKEVEIFRGRDINIMSNEPLVLNADGDIIGTTPANISIEKSSINVIIPESLIHEENYVVNIS